MEESWSLETPVEGGRDMARAVGWVGVASVVASVIPAAFLTGEATQPPWTESPAHILAYYQAATFGPRFVLGVVVEALGFVLFLAFLCGVVHLILRVRPQASWTGRVVQLVAAVEVTLVFVYMAALSAAVFRSDHGGLDSGGHLALHDLRFACYWLSLIATAAYLAPLGMMVLRSGLFPRWIGVAMVANAVGLLVVLAFPTPAWDLAAGLVFVWVLVLGVVAVRRADSLSVAR